MTMRLLGDKPSALPNTIETRPWYAVGAIIRPCPPLYAPELGAPITRSSKPEVLGEDGLQSELEVQV